MSSVTVGDRDAPLFADDSAWDEAQGLLLELELADGLPAVVPTAERLATMLGGRDPASSFGLMPPLFGEITAQAAAWCCVVAGCRPAEFPVVLEAAIATLEPTFNLLGIQTTTGTPTVAALVHGPLATVLGMNAGTNCLGPGNRANACIGRALRLVLTNIGGARPLVGDMATMGQPAKYGMAFAEGEHSLTTPFHARRGLDAAADAVTVIGLSGTLEVLPEAGASTPEAVLRPALAAMQGAREASSGGRRRDPGEQFLLLPPEMADVVAKAGWTLEQAQDFLHSESGPDWPIAHAPRDIHVIVTGGAGVKMTCLVPWGGGTYCVTRPVG
ncbi:MAG TPA: hypothetical protein VHB27_04950 [Rhodopila sp.]|uniref:hypothetical protein n=1 Tax=Rhodopila sp. TaxID=2480087 RepID=UPI002B5DC7AA|nr:hypothetical protein [Rhodopila sp.]HVY14552.1 hypothetical protein [Rhodopila sp.]